MAEKICPFLNQASIDTDTPPWLMCNDGVIKSEGAGDEYKRPCALWDGDCGLKVAQGDRWMKAWYMLKANVVDKGWIAHAAMMDEIEAKMGKSS